MAQLGADVEQLDQLSRKFDQEAQQIAQATQQISSQVNSTWWKGPDADRFKNEWEGDVRLAAEEDRRGPAPGRSGRAQAGSAAAADQRRLRSGGSTTTRQTGTHSPRPSLGRGESRVGAQSGSAGSRDELGAGDEAGLDGVLDEPAPAVGGQLVDRAAQAADAELGEAVAEVVELAVELRDRPAEPAGDGPVGRQLVVAVRVAQRALGERQQQQPLLVGQQQVAEGDRVAPPRSRRPPAGRPRRRRPRRRGRAPARSPRSR